jgi:hypothetical protein
MNRQQQIQDDADSKGLSLQEAGLLRPASSHVVCRAFSSIITSSEGRLDSLEKRVRVLEKKEKKRQLELDHLRKENTALHEVVQDYVEGEDENLRCDREIAIKASQQWKDTSHEMQSSSTATCREEYRIRTKASSAKEKLSMLQRVGTVCCVIFVGSR